MNPSRQPGPDLGPIDCPARSVRRLSVPGLVESILLVLPAVVLPADVAAQETGSVRGRVVDQGSGEPVPGVLVSIEGVDPVLTNGGGMFLFLAVPVGERELTLEHLA